MLKFHRWVSTVGMVFLLWVAVTGTLTTLWQLIDPAAVEAIGSGPAPQGSTHGRFVSPGWLEVARYPRLPPAAVEEMAVTALRAGIAASPSLGTEVSGARIQLRQLDGVPQGWVAFNGQANARQILRFDAVTGEPVALRPFEMSTATLMQALHNGDIVKLKARDSVWGPIAQWTVVITGVAYVVLAFTGIWVYVQMLARRWRLGRRNLFWN